jgi:hypothetical protein
MFLSNSELYSNGSFDYLNGVASQFKHDLNTGRKIKKIRINHNSDFHFVNCENSLRNTFNLSSDFGEWRER